LTASQDREDKTGELVGKRDSDKLEGLVLDQCLCPGSKRIIMACTMVQYRMRAHHEKLAQIAIPHFRDAPQPLFSAGRVLPRRKAKEGREGARARKLR
jgi:hypothetical protein